MAGSLKKEDVKKKIFELVKQYYRLAFNRQFIPGQTIIPNSGKLFDSEELINGVDAVLDAWWTEGRFTSEFSAKLGEFLGVEHVHLTNSGSSANLIALSSLTSHLLKERRIKPGDEVIGVAAGFPTTLNPIIQINAVPVFVDVSLGKYNAIPEEIEKAIGKKTKAIFLAHTLGNPFNLKKIKELCEKHNLWLVEDCCDALGSKYDNKKVGTFGDIASLSFYPAHHITTGEGGAVFTNNSELAKAAASIRDWGRDCWCMPGHENTCGKRFTQKHGDLPSGYDHKYVYSHIGYNMKMTDLQASIGLAQLKKLPDFQKAREKNFKELHSFFSKNFSDVLILPESEKEAMPSWFGYPITVKENAGFSRKELVDFLDMNKVGSRPLFGGNLTKQPYFKNYDIKYGAIGKLENTDKVMNNSFWIGVQPSLTPEMLKHVKDTFKKFIALKK